jgi:hypothetical protein
MIKYRRKRKKIIAAGKLLPMKRSFELNNLPLGNNYILMDESTLPFE